MAPYRSGARSNERNCNHVFICKSACATLRAGRRETCATLGWSLPTGLGTYTPWFSHTPPLWKNRTLAWHIRGLTLASERPLRAVLEDLGVRGSLGPSPALAHHRGFSHRGSQRLVGDALKSKGRMVDQGDRPIKRCVPGVHSASIDFVSATRRSRSSKSAIFGSFCGLKGRKVRKRLF